MLSGRTIDRSWCEEHITVFMHLNFFDSTGEHLRERRQGVHIFNYYHISTSAAREIQWCPSLGSPNRRCGHTRQMETTTPVATKSVFAKSREGAQISMRFDKSSDMLFLNDLRPFGFFKKCAKTSFEIAFPQTIIIHQQYLIGPIKHTAALEVVDINLRDRSTSLYNLAIAVRTAIAISNTWHTLEKTA